MWKNTTKQNSPIGLYFVLRIAAATRRAKRRRKKMWATCEGKECAIISWRNMARNVVPCFSRASDHDSFQYRAVLVAGSVGPSARSIINRLSDGFIGPKLILIGRINNSLINFFIYISLRLRFLWFHEKMRLRGRNVFSLSPYQPN